MIRDASRPPPCARAGGLCGVVASIFCVIAAGAHEHEVVPVAIDSGWVSNEGEARAVVYRTAVVEPGAGCVRLSFDVAQLGEAPAGGAATVLRVTSLTDFETQHLTARGLAQWRDATAYFNGGALLVEIVADPGAGPSRLLASRAWAGVPAGGSPDPTGICGEDDRVPSDDRRVGRLRFPDPTGVVDGLCTCWMINDPNRCFLTAGHCGRAESAFVVEFDVPLNEPASDCTVVAHAATEDQYAVDGDSIQGMASGTGGNWRYFACFPNTETGLTPFQAQGEFLVLEHELPERAGQPLRVTGYGFDRDRELCATQQTATGPLLGVAVDFLEYGVDVHTGSRGSPVIDETSGRAVAIHGSEGCPFIGANFGTATADPDLQAALADPRGLCVPPLKYGFPDGLPVLVHPDGERIAVELGPTATGEPVPGSARLFVDPGDGFVEASMVERGENSYLATFPPIRCGAQVRYYFTAEGKLHEGSFVASVPSPAFGPDRLFTASVAPAFDFTFFDSFDTDLLWTVDNSPGLTTGAWERGEPVGGGDRGDPPTDADGTGNCYATGLANGDHDVDGGTTTLTSPIMDASAPESHVNYYRWFSNHAGPAPFQDTMTIEASDDAGQTWVLLETIGPGGPEVAGGWIHKSFRVADHVRPTAAFRIRFVASDLGDGSIVEAAVDAVRLNQSADGLACE